MFIPAFRIHGVITSQFQRSEEVVWRIYASSGVYDGSLPRVRVFELLWTLV